MGNRGILHDADRKVVKPWAHKHWVTCLLFYQGVKREVFGPGRYWELFFLDEATSFTAGHRPCGRCQRDWHAQFSETRRRANAIQHNVRTVENLDSVLRSERAIRGGGKRAFAAAMNDLPDGALFELGETAYLVWKSAHLRRSFDGYSHTGADLAPDPMVGVLTPPSVVCAIRERFVPHAHRTAERESASTCVPTVDGLSESVGSDGFGCPTL